MLILLFNALERVKDSACPKMFVMKRNNDIEGKAQLLLHGFFFFVGRAEVLLHLSLCWWRRG